MRPRILLAGPDRQNDRLRAYREALELAGATPVRDWPRMEVIGDHEGLRAFLHSFDGLLLPGGADVEPEHYGEVRHGCEATDAELDRVQLALARLILGDGFPTLAICRGIQVLGVAAGGGLYQDLPSQHPSAVNHRVKEPKDALAHAVELDPASRLAAVSGSTNLAVNSRHHQAVRDGTGENEREWVGPLRIVARAPDGVVEGLEHPRHSFVVAVQWHPENLVGSGTEALRLFEEFVEACR
jgi:putative glutamine amidotransferase